MECEVLEKLDVVQEAASLVCVLFFMYSRAIISVIRELLKCFKLACFQFSLQSSYVIYVAYLSQTLK